MHIRKQTALLAFGLAALFASPCFSLAADQEEMKTVHSGEQDETPFFGEPPIVEPAAKPTEKKQREETAGKTEGTREDHEQTAEGMRKERVRKTEGIGEDRGRKAEGQGLREDGRKKDRAQSGQKEHGKFEIPEQAARTRNPALITGCWKESPKQGMIDAPGTPREGLVRGEFCFHNGRVTYTQTSGEDGERAGAEAPVGFDQDGNLVMDIPAFQHRHGTRTAKRRILKCQGTGRQTQCSEYWPDAVYVGKWSRTRLYR